MSNTVFGWSLLSFGRHERRWAETLLMSALLGMYAETMLVGTLLFLGFSFRAAAAANIIAMIAVIGGAFYSGRLRPGRISVEWPKWYEWAMLAAVTEKIAFAAWLIARTPTFFDDALMHWSGRARSLFGEVNWSLDAASRFFMAGHIGNQNYPLGTIIWRALTATVNGEWTDLISRADGLVFFIVVVGTMWLAVWRFSNLRWLAAAAAFVLAALPLQAWHAAAGYSDIAVEAFAIASLAALLRAEWLLSGVMAAGMAWSKNDGLVLYVPSLVVGVLLLGGGRNTARLMLGFATIAPWLVFNWLHGLGVSPGRAEFSWHADAPRLFFQSLVTSSSSSILWIGVLIALIFSSREMLKDETGRALLALFLLSFGTIVFVFTSTSAYAFLADQTTIHRVLMQFSAIAILVASYGLWRKESSRTQKATSP